MLVPHRRSDPVREDPHDEPGAEERRAQLGRLLHGHEEEVRARRQRLQAERAQAPRQTLPLLHLRRDVGRVGERSHRERGGERRDRRGRLAAVQLGGGVDIRERVAHAAAGQSEGLGERAQDDDPLADPRGGRLARVLVVRLVDDQRAGRRELVERAGRIVRPAAERDRRLVVRDLRAGEIRGDAEEGVGRVVGDRHAVARAGKGSRAEEDEVVRAGAQNDVLRLHAGVPCHRRGQLHVAAVWVVLDVRERGRQRAGARRGDGPGGDVPVEADDLDRVEAEVGREVARRGGPGVGGELLRQRPHRRTASAWAGMPSRAARASTTGRTPARPSGVRRCTVTGLRNVSRPSPPTARARPPVGRTWLPPVA